jgi:predicted DCC family thiol-disulfide oxidoreductase YuxK
MKTLYVLYDSECAFCLRCRNWLMGEPAFVPLRFIPRNSPEVGCRFPGIESYVAGGDLVVVGDDGAVYYGPHAFIMCLYALKEYREWALRLSRPELLPLARKAMEALSGSRGTISRWLGKATDAEVREALEMNGAAGCGTGACGVNRN